LPRWSQEDPESWYPSCPWLWGAWGIGLGAPLIAIVKTIADRVAEPVGHLLG
jgi:hypothetical protein